jgi:hypothetical protein
VLPKRIGRSGATRRQGPSHRRFGEEQFVGGRWSRADVGAGVDDSLVLAGGGRGGAQDVRLDLVICGIDPP